MALVLAATAHSQPASTVGGDAMRPKYVPGLSSYDTAPGTGVLVFHLFAEKTGDRLNGTARLDVTNLANRIGVFQIIDGDEDGVFVNLAPGDYEIEASALGYLDARKQVLVVSMLHPQPIEIVLQHDPAAVKLDLAVGTLSPKARKAAKSGLDLLKEGYLDDAKKELEKAYKLTPSNSDLNFLLGYLFFQKKDYGQAVAYLTTAVSLAPNNAQALLLLGRANLARRDDAAARSALERAVLADDDNWLPHDLLADTYLRTKEYGKARDEAEIALAKGQRFGKGVASGAEVVLGQALLGLGHETEALQAFTTFLSESPQNPLAFQVHGMVAELKSHNSTPAPDTSSSNAPTMAQADPLAAVPEPELSTRSWRPFDIDDVKPTLTPGIACPAARVLEESGKRVQAFVQDLARFAADEELFHQSIDAFGFPNHTETRKYDYVAIVTEPQPGAVSIEEYRSDKGVQEGYPDAIQSTGFITLALVFHPDMQKDFQFDCEGQIDWHGQTSWVVHFHQRLDRPNRMHTYSVGGQVYSIGLKGRAWISGNDFQIERMEADMVNPVEQIQLLGEHQVVEYGPVPFPSKSTTLWLPKSAEIYIGFRKHRYYRRHSFSHYLLFSVDTEEKRKEPAATPTQPEEKKTY